MKFHPSILLVLISPLANGFTPSTHHFISTRSKSSTSSIQSTTEASPSSSTTSSDTPPTDLPLLIRAALGQKTERTPVWMMRQAGRHIAEYRELVKKYPTFRQRSEIPEVATEVSLQPVRNYQTDGCILFSDILTPLPGMGCEFEIDEKLGPVMEPIRNWDDAKSRLRKLDPTESTPFIAETLKNLRESLPDSTALLGFVGCPYTLATYLVEGKTSRDYIKTKKMAFEEPELLHYVLNHLAEEIGQYACHQIESGAQLIQIFDSWAGHLSPRDYDTFAAPYQKKVLDKIKAEHPDIPTVVYIKHSGALIERMAKTGVDVVSLDWTVDMAEGRERINKAREDVGLTTPGGTQGNLDPFILFAEDSVIKERTEEILKKAGNRGHVMNLGHGIEAQTPEDKAHFFIETVRNYRHEE